MGPAKKISGPTTSPARTRSRIAAMTSSGPPTSRTYSTPDWTNASSAARTESGPPRERKLRWTWLSQRPGSANPPAASISSYGLPSSAAGPTAWMLPSRTKIPVGAENVPVVASKRRRFEIRRPVRSGPATPPVGGR
jgi:hypothetical protein